jgi:hypothetical protein
MVRSEYGCCAQRLVCGGLVGAGWAGSAMFGIVSEVVPRGRRGVVGAGAETQEWGY